MTITHANSLKVTTAALVAVVAVLVAFSCWEASWSRQEAVCTTDADCAAWEVTHHVPMFERCYGAPCAAGGVR